MRRNRRFAFLAHPDTKTACQRAHAHRDQTTLSNAGIRQTHEPMHRLVCQHSDRQHHKSRQNFPIIPMTPRRIRHHPVRRPQPAKRPNTAICGSPISPLRTAHPAARVYSDWRTFSKVPSVKPAFLGHGHHALRRGHRYRQRLLRQQMLVASKRRPPRSGDAAPAS